MRRDLAEGILHDGDEGNDGEMVDEGETEFTDRFAQEEGEIEETAVVKASAPKLSAASWAIP